MIDLHSRNTIFAISEKLGVKVESDPALTLNNILEQLEKVPYSPYPIAFHTVDIVIWRRYDTGKADIFEVLIGRKPNSKQWQFIGGFVDPKNSAEEAAMREVEEETGLKVTNLTSKDYIGSYFIDDTRYKNSCHKITTSLFAIEVDETNGEPAANDDIAELQWFGIEMLSQAYNEVLIPSHRILFEEFLKGRNGK